MWNSLSKLFKYKKSLRFRLTAWYILLLACTLILFSSYLYLQLHKSLSSQLDKTLEIIAAEVTNDIVTPNGYPTFNRTRHFQNHEKHLTRDGFIGRVLTNEGRIWDGFGSYLEIPLLLPQQQGSQKLSDRQTKWLIYSLPLGSEFGQGQDSTINNGGWLQVGQSLNSIERVSDNLLTLMLIGFPLALCFAALGGLFLADRALRPIGKIIRIAEAIEPKDITRRIGYQDSNDEVGRLAMTLDRMLDRIQAGFEREKRFSSDVAHELRTSLTVIKGRIGVTLSRERKVEQYIDTLSNLERETDRLIRLTNGLLFLGRLEKEKLDSGLNTVLVDLSNLLRVLVEQIQPLAYLKKIQLSEQIEPDIAIQGNPDYLTNLFLNLLDNAVKYTPDRGKVTVRSTITEKQIFISVINTGQGIPAEDLPHLFERFYRVENARSRTTGGDGLGLAIAYEIARLHGGSVLVQSQPQKETIFSVFLPNSSLRMTA
jgi:heavy metal sensor kinase